VRVAISEAALETSGKCWRLYWMICDAACTSLCCFERRLIVS
jgi:hypothetical protein